MSTTQQFKTAGAPASNQYGQFAVRYASTAQQNYIRKLLDERNHEFEDLDPASVNVQNASHIIDQLLRSPVRPDRVAPASDRQLAYIEALKFQRQGGEDYLRQFYVGYGSNKLTAPDAKYLIDNLLKLPFIVRHVVVEVGAYRYNGELYSVRKGQQSGNIHAYRYSPATNNWEFARGIAFELRPEMRLSLAEAMDYGVQTGSCIHCGRTLTDAKSVRYGLGTHCRKFYR
jgi:hypothetical protein